MLRKIRETPFGELKLIRGRLRIRAGSPMPDKPLRDFYAGYSPHTNTATYSVFPNFPIFPISGEVFSFE